MYDRPKMYVVYIFVIRFMYEIVPHGGIIKSITVELIALLTDNQSHFK